VGIPLGYAMGLSNWFRGWFDPIVEFMRPVPPLALIPLVIIWFGIGEVGKIILLFLAALWIMAIAARSGVSACAFPRCTRPIQPGRLEMADHAPRDHAQLAAGDLHRRAGGHGRLLGHGGGGRTCGREQGAGMMIMVASKFQLTDIVHHGDHPDRRHRLWHRHPDAHGRKLAGAVEGPRFSARHLIERRLGDIEMPALDQLRHLPEEKGQQQSADMGAVDIGIGHDDDLVIAQLVGVELVLADTGAKRRDQRADFLAREHLVKAGPFDIEDLASERQDRLVLARTALLGGAAGGIALDQEQFRLGRIALGAIGQLARQEAMSSAPLRRVSSRALRAASRAAAASITLPTRILASAGCSSSQALRVELTRFSTTGRTSEETSLSLVCEENFGSGTFTDKTAVRPSRQSSPVSETFSFLVMPEVSA
jgi:hypothetical protein